ncbi:Zinc finger C2H2-type, partial [Trinorchestia longiramus]
FRCEVCPYSTLLRCDLVKHVRIHTGEKPYACPFCPYRSNQSGNRRIHMRRKHRH